LKSAFKEVNKNKKLQGGNLKKQLQGVKQNPLTLHG
jgi:hypothetical protein